MSWGVPLRVGLFTASPQPPASGLSVAIPHACNAQNPTLPIIQIPTRGCLLTWRLLYADEVFSSVAGPDGSPTALLYFSRHEMENTVQRDLIGIGSSVGFKNNAAQAGVPGTSPDFSRFLHSQPGCSHCTDRIGTSRRLTYGSLPYYLTNGNHFFLRSRGPYRLTAVLFDRQQWCFS